MVHAQIKDVARHAGVSSATVSRVLNGETGVSESLRARVNTAVQALGYQPNRLARNLRRNVTETIGVVVSDIENPHFTRAVRVIENVAFTEGYRVLLCNTDETSDKQRVYLEMLSAERVMGVIVAPADPDDPTIPALIDAGIPIVAFDREVADERADAVTSDNEVAGRLATDYLIDRGHTRIGFISGRPGIKTGSDREQGYLDAMQLRNLPPASYSGNFRIDDAETATRELLHQHPECTAIIVGNNLMTVGTLNALRQAGKSVPDDISLVQLDDPFWAELVSPPLTSYAQPVGEMARSAIELLLQRIRKQRTTSRHIVFQFALQERASVKTLSTQK